MGENTFTFTGLLNETNETTTEVVTNVKVPRHEYALLVAAKAKLDMIEKMVNNMESYAAYPVLKLLLTEEQDE